MRVRRRGKSASQAGTVDGSYGEVVQVSTQERRDGVNGEAVGGGTERGRGLGEGREGLDVSTILGSACSFVCACMCVCVCVLRAAK